VSRHLCAANAVLDVLLDEALLERVRELGELVREHLALLAHVRRCAARIDDRLRSRRGRASGRAAPARRRAARRQCHGPATLRLLPRS